MNLQPPFVSEGEGKHAAWKFERCSDLSEKKYPCNDYLRPHLEICNIVWRCLNCFFIYLPFAYAQLLHTVSGSKVPEPDTTDLALYIYLRDIRLFSNLRQHT